MAEDDGFEEIAYSAPDGLKLCARVYGATHATARLPVVCLPGLTRNARDFHALALGLSAGPEGRMVAAFDYRGRGRSAHDRNWRHYDLAVETADIRAGLAALDIGHAAFIGTSRGGLIIHMLAASRPAALKAIVLNDVGPVIEAEGFAQIRAQFERLPAPKSWEDAVDIQRMALGAAFPALEEDDWQRMARAIFRENERGRIVPDYDPNLLKTIRAVDLSKPLPQVWPLFMGLTNIPTLVIRGENSKLLTVDTLESMRQFHPRLKAITVPGQGHPPMLETGDLPEQIATFVAAAVSETRDEY